MSARVRYTKSYSTDFRSFDCSRSMWTLNQRILGLLALTCSYRYRTEIWWVYSRIRRQRSPLSPIWTGGKSIYSRLLCQTELRAVILPYGNPQFNPFPSSALSHSVSHTIQSVATSMQAIHSNHHATRLHRLHQAIRPIGPVPWIQFEDRGWDRQCKTRSTDTPVPKKEPTTPPIEPNPRKSSYKTLQRQIGRICLQLYSTV